MIVTFRRRYRLQYSNGEREREIERIAKRSQNFLRDVLPEAPLKRIKYTGGIFSHLAVFSVMVGVLRDRKDRRDAFNRHGIHRESRRGESHSRERTRRRPPRGLVKVYDQVIEHPCLSRFLGADLSRRNAA